MKLTPWFSAEAKPARVGVYERDYGCREPEYQFWNGKHWIYGTSSVDDTRSMAGTRSPCLVPHKWRGLATKDGK